MQYILFVIFFVNGCFYATNQSLVYQIKADLSATDNQMALMVASLYLGPMLMVLFFGFLSDKIGRKKSGLLAILCLAIGVLIISFTQNVNGVIFGFFVYGVGVGGFEIVLFAITADINAENSGKYLLLNQALFSIGAMVTPLILVKLISQLSYQFFYLTMLIAIILIGIVLAKLEIQSEIKPDSPISFAAIIKMLKNPYLIFFMVTAAVTTGSESVFTYWIGPYFDSINLLAIGSIALSTYWFASIFGRLVGSRVTKIDKLILPCLFIATGGSLLFVSVPNIYVKLLGVLMVGAAFAPLYPALGYKSSLLFPKYIGMSFALITFSSNFGGAVLQPIIGMVSAFVEIKSVYYGVFWMCAVLTVLTMLVQSKTKRG